MNTRPFGFAVFAGLLATLAWGAEAPDVVAPDNPDLRKAVERGFAYKAALPAKVALPAVESVRDPVSGSASPVVRMQPFEVKGMADQTFKDLNAAMAEAALLAPCDLIVVKHDAGAEFRAFGAPLPPDALLPYALPPDHLQANFPVVTWAW